MSANTYLPSHQTDAYTFGKVNLGEGFGKAVKAGVRMASDVHAAKETDKRQAAKVAEVAKRKASEVAGGKAKTTINALEGIKKIAGQNFPSTPVRDRPAKSSGVTASYQMGGATSNKPRAPRRATSEGATGAALAPRRAQSAPTAGSPLSAAQHRRG